MLEDVYKSYKQCAEVINWKQYNCNELFFKYIEHENDSLSDNFYAGIMCRYWGYTGKLYTKMNKHLSFEQCYDVVAETINYVIEKRVWGNPDSSMYQDPKGPDKAFHMVIKRQLACLMANLTAYKRKTNYNSLSIDSLYEEYNDATEGLFNIYDKSTAQQFQDISVIQYIKSRPTIQKLILNQICFGAGNKRNVVTNIKKLGEDDFLYFNQMYGVQKEDYHKALNEIKVCSNNRLNQEINKTLTITRKEYFQT